MHKLVAQKYFQVPWSKRLKNRTMAILLTQNLMRKSKKPGVLQKGFGVRQLWNWLFLATSKFCVWVKNKLYTYSCGQDACVCLFELNNFINIYYMLNTILYSLIPSTTSRTLQVLQKWWWLLLVNRFWDKNTPKSSIYMSTHYLPNILLVPWI